MRFVRLKLEAENMRHSIVAALVDHEGEGEIEAAVNREVQLFLDSEIDDLVRDEVAKHTRDALAQGIRHAIGEALHTTEIRDLLADRVRRAVVPPRTHSGC